MAVGSGGAGCICPLFPEGGRGSRCEGVDLDTQEVYHLVDAEEVMSGVLIYLVLDLVCWYATKVVNGRSCSLVLGC
jgi:hypothetical protein